MGRQKLVALQVVAPQVHVDNTVSVVVVYKYLRLVAKHMPHRLIFTCVWAEITVQSRPDVLHWLLSGLCS